MNFGGFFDLDQKEVRLQSLEQEALSPDFWNDQKKAKAVSKEKKQLESVVEHFHQLEKLSEETSFLFEMLKEEKDPDLQKEGEEKIILFQRQIEDLEFERMLSGEHDHNNAILTINAGAGGTESCDWAEILLRMYRMWADKHGYRNDVVDFTGGDQAGFRRVTLTVSGENAYGYLKAEVGVHRLVRISPFDANKRRHTSFSSVFVIPDIEEDIEIEVDEGDLRIDTFRAGGAGGQKVNKTDSAVRLTHLPSGIVVACQIERSQHQNKETAMRLLKAKLYEAEMKKKAAEKDQVEASKKENEWGSQIRSYVLHPYKMIKDHRTNFEVGNAQKVLDGDLDPFIQKFLLSGDTHGK
ncbi:MAG: peptide chain release factor 2 [bacterium]|nr:peptide chain release factor 2 [bacterium]